MTETTLVKALRDQAASETKETTTDSPFVARKARVEWAAAAEIERQASQIERLTAENERLSNLSEKLRHSLQVIGADKANPAWTRSLANESAAYQQTTVCSTCGGSGVEKAIAGNGYHWCPDCRRE